jgi:hypothetical protein
LRRRLVGREVAVRFRNTEIGPWRYPLGVHLIECPVERHSEADRRQAQTASSEVINDPEMQQQLTLIGYTPTYMDAETFTKYVFSQEKIFARVAKEAKLKQE